MMNCAICHRHHNSQRLPFLCPVDVRNRLYELRLAHAAVLLQNEQLERQVNADLRGADDGAAVEDAHKTLSARDAKREPGGETTAASARSRFDAWEGERQAVLDRTSAVAARAEALRHSLEATRTEVARRREALQRRRSDLAAAGNGTAARRARVVGEAERAIAMTRYRWNHLYDGMAATRGFLCMEAAKLYGLRRGRKGRYELGGLEIVDPYNMNNLPHEVISTSLAHITHILLLACHYLSIRLPAEITLPHRDYPRPTAFTLLSSYSHGAVPFPGTANLHPALAATAGAAAAARVPHPRPLFVDKALPLLAKDDGAAHTLFLEGLALLAYDVAWVCCAQGVPIGDKASTSSSSSFDDVFSIGRNLYNLLIGNQRLSNPAQRIFAAPAEAAGAATAGASADATGGGRSPPLPAAMGRYSHGTAHTFLGDALLQTFKLPSPNRLADRLKTKLSSESTMPDWEVLEDDAWAVDDGGDDEEDRDNMEDGVLPRGAGGTRRLGGEDALRAARGGGQGGSSRTGPDAGGRGVTGPREKRLFGVESIATVITSLEDTMAEAELEGQRAVGGRNASGSSGKAKGGSTSGWTKLRNR